MEILGKIFGTPARVKIMRLFLVNKNKVFLIKDISVRSRINPDIIRKELKILHNSSFIKKRGLGYIFNPFFPFTKEFESLLINSNNFDEEALTDMFKKVGRLKFLVVSGVFIKNKDSRVDILLVGDKINKAKVDDTVKRLEAEMGTELVYAVFTTKDFIYRLNMYDKLVRDILDFPHQVILQAKELSTQILLKP